MAGPERFLFSRRGRLSQRNPVRVPGLADRHGVADEPYIAGYGDQFKAFLATHGVSKVIVPESEYPFFAKLCATLAAPPIHTGGVIIFPLPPQGLANFSHMTAAQMDARYNLGRFESLLDAAHGYLARGYPVTALSPSAAVRLGLLDPTIAGDPALSQTEGFPFVRVARSSAAFQAVARFSVLMGFSASALRLNWDRCLPKMRSAPAESGSGRGATI